MSDPVERRKNERAAGHFEVHFSEPLQAARALRAYSLNFSAGGLCLRTQHEYTVGTPLSLRMTIDGEEFELKGMVAWVRGGAIGVRFEELSEEVRHRLDELSRLASRKTG